MDRLMNKRRFFGLFMVILTLTTMALAGEIPKKEDKNGDPTRKTTVQIVGITLGSTVFSFKDAAGRRYWTPVILNGSGPYIQVFYKRECRNRLQAFSIYLNSTGGFFYDTGVREIDLPEGNRYTDFGLEYGLIFFLLRDVLFKNLDFGIGPGVRAESMNFKRFYAPDIVTHHSEIFPILSFTSAARFRLARILRFDLGFSYGILAGISKLTHRVSGTTPLHVNRGLQTEFNMAAKLALSSRLALTADVQSQARSWGLNRVKKSLVSLSLEYELRRRQ